MIVFLLGSVAAKSQVALTFRSVDSITYQCYLTGDWDNLLATGNLAVAQDIDFKYLRQRMGYAYFAKADYYASLTQYEKALEFDEYDAGTREYLYYCGLNTGNIVYARYHAQKLPDNVKQKLGIKGIDPVATADLEYNYKSNNSDIRSNPTYFRGGIYTHLGYRVSIYQSASDYIQTVNNSLIKQPDYFALINYSVSSHTSLSVAYHHLNTSIDGIRYPGNLLFASVTRNINRLVLGMNGSFFRYSLGDFGQAGLRAAYTLPGKSNMYFNTYLSGLMDKDSSRLIFSQYAGARIYKSLWAEANVTLGNLQNYNDHNALYIYNSIDPTIFRTGFSLYWNKWKHLSIYGNYLYDIKQTEQTTNQYIQQSFLGGIIWKR